MTARAMLTTTACFLFCTFIQFAGALSAAPWTLLAGGISAAGFWLLLRFFEVDLPHTWARMLLLAGSRALGVAGGSAGGNHDLFIWWAPACAAAVAGFGSLISLRMRNRCHLCNRWLRRSVVSFECPRCGFLVCEECWEFDHLRCRLCEQNHVPAFSPDARWWDQHLGARVNFGRCQICLTTSDRTDLRSCGRCGRPQCRDCWDNANGQCSRCNWVVDDLPETLRPYMPNPIAV